MTSKPDSLTEAGDVFAAVAIQGRTGRSVFRLFSILIALSGALIVLLALAGCGSDKATETTKAAVDTGGRLQLTETTFDAGNVPVNQKVEHGFTIRNTGTGPLEMGQMAVKRLEGC